LEIGKANDVIETAALVGKRYTPGNVACVQVLGVWQLKSGRPIVELKPAPRQQQ
jgi:hypothetical protein